MAMTPEEKKAYRREYYQKYQKKGLKKGRRKGTGRKKSSSTGIVGISTSGLNDAGKMEYAMIKDDLKKKMNSELASAKTDADREQIRRKYQQQALDAAQKLKSDSQYAKPSTAKAPKSSGSSKGSKGSSSKSSGSSKSTGSGGSTGSKSSSSKTAEIKALTKLVEQLTKSMSTMSDKQKAAVKTLLTDIVTKLKKKYGVSVKEGTTNAGSGTQVDKSADQRP